MPVAGFDTMELLPPGEKALLPVGDGQRTGDIFARLLCVLCISQNGKDCTAVIECPFLFVGKVLGILQCGLRSCNGQETNRSAGDVYQ